MQMATLTLFHWSVCPKRLFSLNKIVIFSFTADVVLTKHYNLANVI